MSGRYSFALHAVTPDGRAVHLGVRHFGTLVAAQKAWLELCDRIQSTASPDEYLQVGVGPIDCPRGEPRPRLGATLGRDEAGRWGRSWDRKDLAEAREVRRDVA